MPPDERTYWIEQMEAAHAFMQRLLEYPLVECGEPLASLPERSRAAGMEIVFAEGKKLVMFERVFCVRRSLVEPLMRAAEALLKRGYALRLEDAYRSPHVQARGAGSAFAVGHVLEKVRWELGGRTPTADLVFRRLAAWTATTLKLANHTFGSAVDATVVRRDGARVDLGGTYPELSPCTPMDSPWISAEVRRHRRMLCEVFGAEGFVPYPFEFWHFSRGDADCEMIRGSGLPGRFGPVRRLGEDGRILPVADVLRPLVTEADVARRLKENKLL